LDIILTEAQAGRFWDKVDKTGECWNWTGAKKAAGYGQLAVNKRMLIAHRVSYTLANGQIPDGVHIDHRCHNKSCVNPAHLRPATQKQNNENPGVLRSDNTSGYRGVTWDPKNKKWVATVFNLGKTVHVGRFSSIEHARDAAIEKRNELFTHNDLDKRAA